MTDEKMTEKSDDSDERAFVIVLQPYARPEINVPVTHYLPVQPVRVYDILDVWTAVETARSRGWFQTRLEDGRPGAMIDLTGCIIQIRTKDEHDREVAEMQKRQAELEQKQRQQQEELARRLQLSGVVPGGGVPAGAVRVVPRGGLR